MKPRKSSRPKIALALAGGGPLGAIYEIGALCALDESMHGLALTQLDHYVGVSAGSFIAAGLANGISPRELYASFIDNDDRGHDVFDPSWLMVPAYREFARRATMVPGLVASALWCGTVGGGSLTHALERLGPGLPTGLFSNELMERQLAALFSRAGRTNDFREALHASIALDDGVDLMLCLNPLVPFDCSAPLADGAMPREHRPIRRIADGGLPAVLSQTFRSMIHSRMELGMKHYERAYPDTDIVLIEPDHRDAELYLANTFSYGQRRRLAEHAYQQTRALLRSQRTSLGAKLAKHGISLRADRLGDPRRKLVARPQPPIRISRVIASLHEAMDDLGHVVQCGLHPAC
jgi:NTE family protein